MTDIKKLFRILTRTALACLVGVLLLALLLGTVGIPRSIVRRAVNRIEKAHRLIITVERVQWVPWHRLTAHGVRVSAPSDVASVRFPAVRLDVGPASKAFPEEPSFAFWFTEGSLHVSPADGRAPMSVRVDSGHLLRDAAGQIRFTADIAPLDDWTFALSGRIRSLTRTTTSSPIPLGDRLLVLGDKAYEALHAFEDSRRREAMPASLTAKVDFDIVAGSLQGSIAWGFLNGGGFRIRDLEFSGCSAALRWTNGVLHADSFRAYSSQADAFVHGRGTLMPSWDADGSYECHIESDATPAAWAALLPTNVTPFATSFDVAGTSRTEARIQGVTGRPGMVSIQGTIHATDVTRNQVAVDRLHASFSYSNATLQVEDLAIVRKGGQITGAVEYRPADNSLYVDARSTVAVPEMARFIGAGLDQAVAPYRFEGPVTVECRGVLGLKGNAKRDMRLHVDGKGLGWRWFVADDANLDVLLGEKTTTIEGFQARWCNGNVSGSLQFEQPMGTNAARRCNIKLSLAEADLASVVGVFRDMDDRKPYEGKLSGHVELSGSVGPRFFETATGSGRVDIQNGYILSIPIFGGLSKYLSLLIPGLGYASQRDLRATFIVRDGRVESTDAELLGKAITIRGKGSYAFNRDVSVRVQVQFLKEGLTATVTRVLTSPLTKALELELTGTTKEPHWRPVNTPDRLLKFFTENLGKLVPKGTPRGAGQADPKASQRAD